jgi:hypothetical protein
MEFARLPIAARLAWTGAALVVAAACATAPKRTAASQRIGANPPGFVEGRVRDPGGRPAARIGVRGIPRGAEIPWSPPVTTDCDGRFRLPLAAPGDYGFLLILDGRSVVTADPRDPSLVEATVLSGETRRGIELLFLPAEWARVTERPADTPSCP